MVVLRTAGVFHFVLAQNAEEQSDAGRPNKSSYKEHAAIKASTKVIARVIIKTEK